MWLIVCGVAFSCSLCVGDAYPIAQFIQNPSYGSPTLFSNDIAVVRLQSPITTAGAQAVDIR